MKLNHHAAIDRIMSYPFAQVREKLMVSSKLDVNVIDDAIAEFRKYLSLIARGHRNVGMISREVDEVWHTFILFTRDYMSFCDDVFGHYLHHQPSIPSKPMGEEPRLRFLKVYRQEFGEPSAIWKGDALEVSPTDGCCGESCSPDPSCSGDPDPTVVSHVAAHQ